MCLACMEYLKGNLKDSEFKHNIREYIDLEHDPKALEKAEIKLNKKDTAKNAKADRKVRK